MWTLRLALVLILMFVGASSEAIAEEKVNRVRPLAAKDWSPEVRKLLGGTRERVARLEGQTSPGDVDSESEPKTLNILRTIAHHPKLLGPFLGFAATLAQNGELTRRDSEMLALRAAWNCQSDFEWGHHAVYARAAGLSDDEIARIAAGPGAPDWSADDRTLLLAADQLHKNQQIEDGVWDRLAERFSEAQLVEIPFVVGQYTMLSMVANSTGVELEAEHESLPVRGKPAHP